MCIQMWPCAHRPNIIKALELKRKRLAFKAKGEKANMPAHDVSILAGCCSDVFL